MSSIASLNAQAVASDGKNWLLTIAHDGTTALYREGEKMAELEAALATGILTADEEAIDRSEKLLARLEERSDPIDPHAREILLNSAQWIDAHWS